MTAQGEERSNKGSKRQDTAKRVLTKSHRELFFLSEKQTTVRNEIVFIIQKYFSGYMSHCEGGVICICITQNSITVGWMFAHPAVSLPVCQLFVCELHAVQV